MVKRTPRGSVGRHDHRGLLVEAADQAEQQLAAGLCEWKIAKLVEDNEVHLAEMLSHPPLAPGTPLRLEFVDQLGGTQHGRRCSLR